MNDSFEIGGVEFDAGDLNEKTKAECVRLTSLNSGDETKRLYDQLMNDKDAYELFMKQMVAVTISSKRAVPAFALLGVRNLAQEALDGFVKAFHWVVRMRVTHEAIKPVLEKIWDDLPPKSL